MTAVEDVFTCAEGLAFTGGTNGLLAFLCCLLILAVLTAGAVSVAVGTNVNPSL